MTLTRDDIRRSNDISQLASRVIHQRISGQRRVTIHQFDLIHEESILRISMIFPMPGSQRSRLIHNFSAFIIIAHIIITVEIKRIGIKRCSPVTEHHLLATVKDLCDQQFIVTVIKAIVTSQREGIPLHHLHMTPGFKRITLLKIVGTVAIQVGTVMLKLHLSAQHLSIIILPNIKKQLIGMYQVHPTLLRFLLWS